MKSGSVTLMLDIKQLDKAARALGKRLVISIE